MRKMDYIKIVVVTIALFLLATRIHATTYTWIGGSGPSWTEPLNWQGGSYPGFTINVDDIVNITNLGYLLDFNGTLNIYGILNNNQFFQNYGTVNNYGTINNNGSATFNNYGILNNDGNLNNFNLAIFNIAQTGATMNNNGIINNNLGMDAGGRIGIGGGVLNNNTSGIINNNTGCALNISSIIMNDGILNNNGTISNGGMIKGAGTIVSNNNWSNSANSTFEPGNSVGTLTVSGNLNLGLADYLCEIDGASMTSDLMAISSHATLSSAKLTVTWLTNPTVSGTYTLMSFSSRTGQFASVTIPPVPGITFDLVYSNTSVSLVAALLPVELINFTGKEYDGKIQLDWNTASEINNERFEIERSTGDIEWQTLGYVGGNGSSLDIHKYSFLDNKPLPGTNYYRLKQVDFDGKFEYSKVISVILNFDEVKIFPNPATDIIEINGNVSDTIHLRLFDSQGKLVLSQSHFSNKVDISNLEKGIYIIELRMDNQVMVKRILKE